LIELPGGPLIVQYEALPGTECLINDRRIYLNQASPTEPGEGNLAEMTTVAAAAIPGTTMIAYGKNFEVEGSIEGVDNIGHFLRDRFLQDLAKLETAFGGPVLWLSPNLKYVVGDVEYQLRIGRHQKYDTIFKAHLNIHHATDSLPGLEELRRELRDGFHYLRGLLDKVLSGRGTS